MVGAIVGRRIDQRWALYLALIVLNALDVVTTALVLARGGRESNPFVEPIIDDLFLVSLLKGAILVLVGSLLLRCRESRIAEISLTMTTGWYLAVVSWNVTVLAAI